MKSLRIWGGNVLQALIWLSGTPLSALPLIYAGYNGDKRNLLRAAIFAIALYLVIFSPYSLSGVRDFGPVYLCAIIPLLLIVVASGLVSPTKPERQTGLRALVYAGILVSMLTFLPLKAWQLAVIARNVRAPYDDMKAKLSDQPTLVLVKRHYPSPTGWVLEWPTPDPFLKAPLIVARAHPSDVELDDLKALHRRLQRQYAETRDPALVAKISKLQTHISWIMKKPKKRSGALVRLRKAVPNRRIVRFEMR